MAQVERPPLKATYAAQDADSFTGHERQYCPCKCPHQPSPTEPEEGAFMFELQ